MNELEKDKEINSESEAEETCCEDCQAVQNELDNDNSQSVTGSEKESGKNSESEKIAKLGETLSAEKDKYIRLLAEYDNFRKRSFQDKINAVTDATAKTIIEILSVIDNFERALSAECSDANYKKGIEMIFNQYNDILAKLGVKEIEALGKPFDPNFHNAVNQVQDENFGENTVCQVFQKGYMLGDKVIRCSMVVVANP